MNELESICQLSPAAIRLIVATVGLLEDESFNESQDDLPLGFWQSFDTLCQAHNFGRDFVLSVWQSHADQSEYIRICAA